MNGFLIAISLCVHQTNLETVYECDTNYKYQRLQYRNTLYNRPLQELMRLF